MAQEGYGGLAEGLLAGFNTVTRAIQNAQNLKMQQEELKQRERQADSQLMNYYVNQMSMRGLADSIKSTAFEGYKGILKKNAKDFGITDPSVIDSYRWDSTNKALQEGIKSVAALNKDLDAGKITRSQHRTSLMEIFAKVKDPDDIKILEQAATASAAENLRMEEREQKKQDAMFTALTSQNLITQTGEGEGNISGYNASTTGSLVESAAIKRREDIEAKKDVIAYENRNRAEAKASAPLTPSQRLAQEKHLDDIINKRYGSTEGTTYLSQYKVEEIMQVKKIALELFRSGRVSAPEAAIIAEKTVLGDLKEKKFAQDVEAPDKGMFGFGGNIDKTAKKMEKWDGDPVFAVESLLTEKWTGSDLVKVSRKNKTVATAIEYIENKAKETGTKGWYKASTMPGILFYWDGKSVSNIRKK